MEVIEKITIPEALKALQYLKLYEEQQDDGDREIIKRLSHYEREVKDRVDSTLVQSSIDSFFPLVYVILYRLPTCNENFA